MFVSRTYSLLLAVAFLMFAGCSTKGTLLSDYENLEVDGGTLVVAPLNRSHDISIDVEEIEQSESSNVQQVLLDEVFAGITKRSGEMTRFDAVVEGQYGQSFDFIAQVFKYSPSYGKEFEFEIRLPAPGTQVQFAEHDAEYVLFIGDITIREQNLGGPPESAGFFPGTGPKAYQTKSEVDYVLWDNVKGQPVSYGIIMQDMGRYSASTPMKIAEAVAKGIFAGTPFEAPREND